MGTTSSTASGTVNVNVTTFYQTTPGTMQPAMNTKWSYSGPVTVTVSPATNGTSYVYSVVTLKSSSGSTVTLSLVMVYTPSSLNLRYLSDTLVDSNGNNVSLYSGSYIMTKLPTGISAFNTVMNVGLPQTISDYYNSYDVTTSHDGINYTGKLTLQKLTLSLIDGSANFQYVIYTYQNHTPVSDGNTTGMKMIMSVNSAIPNFTLKPYISSEGKLIFTWYGGMSLVLQSYVVPTQWVVSDSCPDPPIVTRYQPCVKPGSPIYFDGTFKVSNTTTYVWQ